MTETATAQYQVGSVTPDGTVAGAEDIDEQNALCTGCAKPIKRYGSDGIWFTDRYACTAGGLHHA